MARGTVAWALTLLSLWSSAFAQTGVDPNSQEVTGICGVGNICQNGACCAVAPGATSGYCGYGPDYCSTTNQTECISNCDALAQCGPYAATADFMCPLNVCCSQWGFCGTTSDFCNAECVSGCDTPSNPTTGCASGSSLKRVIGYYESWAISQPCDVILPEELPVNSYTHLYFSFAAIDPSSYTITPASSSDVALYTRLTGLKETAPGLRVYISIGGWSFTDPGPTFTTFSNLSSNSGYRQTFAQSLVNFMTLYGFDGADIDWEYPGAPERGGSPVDTDNFITLLADIKVAFASSGHADWGLTFTAPSSYYYMAYFDIPGMLEFADWVNVMTYDLHGTWDATDPWIGPYLLASTNLTEIGQTMDLMWRQNVPASDVVLGIGFYGRSFTLTDPTCSQPGYYCTFAGGGDPGPCTQSSGTLSYQEIVDIISENDLTPILDTVSATKYITWGGNQWVAYDDPDTLQMKREFADDNCLGGVMVWSVDQDTLSFEATAGLTGAAVIDALLNSTILPTVLVPNGQYCAATTNCGDACPSGYVQVNADGQPAYVPDGCPTDSPRKICCPVTAVPSTCSWVGSGDCSDGYCSDGQVTVAVSSSGDGAACRGDGAAHKEFCCSTDISMYLIENTCEWASECTSVECPSDYPIVQTTAQGNPPCSAYGLSGNLQPLCCSSNIFQNCAWHGTPADDCADNVCPPGQFVLHYDLCGDLPIGQCCPYNTQRLYCCDPPADSALQAPVPIGDLFDNPPDQTQAVLTYRVEILDGSGSDDPNSHPFGSLFLDGDPSDITSMSNADWVVTDCDSDLEEAQTVRVFCTSDFNSSSCGDLTASHTIDTIVKLPTSCSKGNYVRVANFTLSSNQDLSDDLSSLKPVSENVYDLQFDYSFDKIDTDVLTDDIVFRVDTSNMPGYWDAVIDSSPTGSARMGKRELQARWWGAFLAWLQGITTIDTSYVKKLDVAGPKSFNYPLYNQALYCPTLNLSITATIGVSGQVSIPITYGVVIIGSLLPTPSISNSYVFIDGSASASATFYAEGSATLVYDSTVVNLFTQAVFGFSFPGIATVGPALALDAYLTGSLTLSGNFAAGFQFQSPDYHFSLPDDGSNYADTGVGDAPSISQYVTPSMTAGASVNGSVAAHLVPRAQIGLQVGWQGAMAIEAVAALSMDTSVTFGFNAGVSASTSSGVNADICLWADAGLSIYGGLSGSVLGGVLSASSNTTFYDNPSYNLFETPTGCHVYNANDDEELLLDLPEFSWDHMLAARASYNGGTQCPGDMLCLTQTTCSYYEDSDCPPSGCLYLESGAYWARRSLVEERASNGSLELFNERDILQQIKRDSITGSGGEKSNVPFCGTRISFPAVAKAGLPYYDYAGGLANAQQVFALGVQTFFNPPTNFMYVLTAGTAQFGNGWPDNQGSYYQVLANFEQYMRDESNIAAATINSICALVSVNNANTFQIPILTPYTAGNPATGNVVMAAAGMNSFKNFVFSAFNNPPQPNIGDPGQALRRMKYIASVGYYLNDPDVNNMFTTTSDAVRAIWVAAGNQVGVGQTVGSEYDAWLEQLVGYAEGNAENMLNEIFGSVVSTWTNNQLCYGVTTGDVSDFLDDAQLEDEVTNFNLV